MPRFRFDVATGDVGNLCDKCFMKFMTKSNIFPHWTVSSVNVPCWRRAELETISKAGGHSSWLKLQLAFPRREWHERNVSPLGLLLIADLLVKYSVQLCAIRRKNITKIQSRKKGKSENHNTLNSSFEYQKRYQVLSPKILFKVQFNASKNTGLETPQSRETGFALRSCSEFQSGNYSFKKHSKNSEFQKNSEKWKSVREN